MPRGVSRYDEARLQGRLWTPSLLTCDLWYDAADLSTITVATGVSEWRDKSGNANHATQSTANLRPTFESVSVAGLPAVKFDTASTYKQLVITTQKQYTTSNPECSLFSVTRFTSERMIALGGGDSGDASFFGDNSSTQALWRHKGDGPFSPTIPTALFSSWHVLSGVRTSMNTSGATMWANGGTMTNGTGTVSDTFSAARIGYRTGWGQGSNGWVGEVIAIPRALSTRERQLVEGYLAQKWGIALRGDHPFHYRAPTLGD